MGMFDLSTKGFKQVFADRSVSRMIEELVANAFDENVARVDVTFEHLGRQEYRLKVTDDNPTGFADLRDAYTVFAPSKKKEDPTKRGRFCFGEKWVIARCQEVIITSTGGRVIFDVANDQRSRSPKATERGTVVECWLRTTNDEYQKACATAAYSHPRADYAHAQWADSSKSRSGPHRGSISAHRVRGRKRRLAAYRAKNPNRCLRGLSVRSGRYL